MNGGPKPGQISLATQHFLCHFPKDPSCEICQRAKATNRPARRKLDPAATSESPEDLAVEKLEPKKFGDLITADHIILRERQASRSGDTAAMICLDVATQALGVYPMVTNSTEHTIESFSPFRAPHCHTEACLHRQQR
jgi:hypothetical protein